VLYASRGILESHCSDEGERSAGGLDMKLVSRDISGKDGGGSVVIRPEESEDMWHIYNLLMVGDSVRTTTFRKVSAGPRPHRPD
jgi:hypothetical protein